ncbi:hypothetical protein [Paracidovorax anthurii]|uniref:Lipoprotein n=1 Tax=Paracidovorax anthurii TaxID=78229 RepID=A0A328YI01_9BURK|nr:hypothetical protein [Paracidovorax anthurii]RAR72683.1 hypothetical protein AX018_10793 [Paracidovorax anthurii]
MLPPPIPGRRAVRGMVPCLLCAALAALAACGDAPLPPTRFQIDQCGRSHAWEDKETRWNTLYAAQLDGHDELVIALGIPQPPEEAPHIGTGVQFNLFAAPGLLRLEHVGGLAGTFRLHADGAAEIQHRQAGTGAATLFRHPAAPWSAASGELQITEVRVTEPDAQGDARAVVSGHYTLEMEREGGSASAPCTVRGSFQGATFRLRSQAG